MPLYIALFRGINVGGRNSLPMNELAQILSDCGSDEIRTTIQSGNAVFENADMDASRLAEKISFEVGKRRGFTPQILVLTRTEFGQAIAENPFPEHTSDPGALHLGFLAATPVNVKTDKLMSLKAMSEKFLLTSRVFFLYAPDGVGRSRLAAGVEKVLGVTMTDRNWKTVSKISELIDSMAK
jgi:uncharacterized protein (DUF1697 family)